jgi:hypothetical protein
MANAIKMPPDIVKEGLTAEATKSAVVAEAAIRQIELID